MVKYPVTGMLCANRCELTSCPPPRNTEPFNFLTILFFHTFLIKSAQSRGSHPLCALFLYISAHIIFPKKENPYEK